MAYVIIGASGELGRALAGRFAAGGHDLILAARQETSLAPLCAELSDRHGIRATAVSVDVTDVPDALSEKALEITEAARLCGGIEGVLLPIGLSLRDTLSSDGEQRRRVMDVNFTGPADMVTLLWPELRRNPGAMVAGFGSITAFRGRPRNMIYGAAKRALAAWFESLRLAGDRHGIAVRFYVVGFLNTREMAGEKTAVPKGSPTGLADRVYRDIGRGSGLRFYPWWWRPLGWLLRGLPWSIYRRIAGT